MNLYHRVETPMRPPKGLDQKSSLCEVVALMKGGFQPPFINKNVERRKSKEKYALMISYMIIVYIV